MTCAYFPYFGFFWPIWPSQHYIMVFSLICKRLWTWLRFPKKSWIFNHTLCLQSWIFFFNTLFSPLICGSQGKESTNNLSMASNGFSTPSQLGNYTCKCSEYIQFNVKRHDVLWNFVEWEVTCTSIHLFRLHILCI